MTTLIGIGSLIGRYGSSSFEYPHKGELMIKRSDISVEHDDIYNMNISEDGTLIFSASRYSNIHWHNTIIDIISPSSQHISIISVELSKNSDMVNKVSCYEYTVELKNGVIRVDGWKTTRANLGEFIKRYNDCFKNPRNRPIWDLLNQNDVPVYDGNELFVASDKTMYMNILGEWLWVNSTWIEMNEGRIPKDIEDEMQLYNNLHKRR